MTTLSDWLLDGMVRTTLATSLAAVATWFLLPRLGVRSPRVHRVAWVLVIVQGWLLMPLTITWTVPRAEERELFSATVVSQVELQGAKDLVSEVVSQEPIDWGLLGVRILSGVWLVGMLMVLGIYVRRYSWLKSHLSLGSAADSMEWKEEWREATAEISSPEKVRLRVTKQLGPLLCYVPYVYLVLVPRALWSGLARSDRLAILRHELAHYERGDLWKNVAIRLLALPQWFNPLVWLAVRRFEEASEWACDEAVLDDTDMPVTGYADTLLRVAGFSAEVPCGSVAASGGVLTRRVSWLLDSKDKEVSKMKNVLVPLLLLGLATSQLIRIESVQAESVRSTNTVSQQTYEKESRSHDRAQAVAQWQKQEYVIEPPDILLIEGVKLKPKMPYKINVYDVLRVKLDGKNLKQKIDDAYQVDADGNVNLGSPYGKIKVLDATIEEVPDRIRAQLAKKFADIEVSTILLLSDYGQQISGQHIVGPDGRVNLGFFGTVDVAGLTVEKAKAAVEAQLSEEFESPEVFVDVLANNSKVVYVIEKRTDGDRVVRLPCKKDTKLQQVLYRLREVVDVEAEAYLVSSYDHLGKDVERLEVDLKGLVFNTDLKTNYSLLPGDRLFVESKRSSNQEKNSEAVQPPVEVPVEAYSAPIDEAVLQDNTVAVKCSFRIVEDYKNSLAEIDGIKAGESIIADSRSTLGLIRVLEKNNLGEVVVKPTVVAEIGKSASVGAIMHFEGISKPQRLDVGIISIRPSIHEKGVSVATDVFCKDKDFKTITHRAEPVLKLGQSCVLRLPYNMDNKIADETKLYLVITREFLK